MKRLAAALAASFLAAGCATKSGEGEARGQKSSLAAPPVVQSPTAITPLVDHHMHILGPYALPLETPPEEVVVPAALVRLLGDRAKFFLTPPADDALSSVYTSDPLVLDGFIDKRWMRRSDELVRYLSLWKGAQARFAPYTFRLDGEAAYVAGAVVGADSGNASMNFIFGLSKGPDGRWRIASEALTEKKPPTFTEPVTADKLIAQLDQAGIRRALVLSEAFWLGGPGAEKVRRLAPSPDKVTAVQRENDWAAAQVARFPDRLVLACGVNPLEDHAIAEMQRCARVHKARAVKANVGEGGDNIDLHDSGQVERLRDFFVAANGLRMPVVIHMGSHRRYGAEEVRIFLTDVLSAAPDIPVQIAHMSSGLQSSEALMAFADARASSNPGARNLYFDLSVGSLKNLPPETARLLADAIRKIGLEHVLFASDVLPGDHHVPTGEHWADIRNILPLTDQEFSDIADNIAPYMLPCVDETADIP